MAAFPDRIGAWHGAGLTRFQAAGEVDARIDARASLCALVEMSDEQYHEMALAVTADGQAPARLW